MGRVLTDLASLRALFAQLGVSETLVTGTKASILDAHEKYDKCASKCASSGGCIPCYFNGIKTADTVLISLHPQAARALLHQRR